MKKENDVQEPPVPSGVTLEGLDMRNYLHDKRGPKERC